jgi:hypothetical protein
MKKTVNAVLSLVLVLGVVFTLAACGINVAGRYELTTMEIDGQVIDIERMKILVGEDLEMYIELREDGTAILKMNEEITDMLWADGKIWPKHNTAEVSSLVIDGTVLTMERNGTKMIFKK